MELVWKEVKLITFERRQAYCQGALVVQDPMDPTNNVTAGCFQHFQLLQMNRKAQARIQNRYFEFRAISVSFGSSTKAHTEDKVGDISLLGALLMCRIMKMLFDLLNDVVPS